MLLVGVPALGFVLSEFLIEFSEKSLNYFPPKPFSCGYCLSWWIGGAIALFQGYDFINSILIAATCAVLNIFLFKLINK